MSNIIAQRTEWLQRAQSDPNKRDPFQRSARQPRYLPSRVRGHTSTGTLPSKRVSICCCTHINLSTSLHRVYVPRAYVYVCPVDSELNNNNNNNISYVRYVYGHDTMTTTTTVRFLYTHTRTCSIINNRHIERDVCTNVARQLLGGRDLLTRPRRARCMSADLCTISYVYVRTI